MANYLRMGLSKTANVNTSLPTEASATDGSTVGTSHDIVMFVEESVTFDQVLQRLRLFEAQLRDNLTRSGSATSTPTLP